MSSRVLRGFDPGILADTSFFRCVAMPVVTAVCVGRDV
jgi:hypothetical protein